MEEQDVARREFGIHELHYFLRLLDPLGVGLGLIAKLAVLDPPKLVRAAQDLHHPFARVFGSTARKALAMSGKRQPFKYQ